MTASIAPFANYCISGKDLLRVLGLLTRVDQDRITNDINIKRIIGSLAWTEEDLPDIDYLMQLDDRIDGLSREEIETRLQSSTFGFDDQYDEAISMVNRTVEDVCIRTILGDKNDEQSTRDV